MSEPLVSIVIPLFNKEAWIIQTLASVYNQSYKNWECIIINDGSTDQSLNRVLEFIDLYPGNWVISNITNSGQAHARNCGIEISKGDLIAFLDADDLWHPNKLQSQVELFLIYPDVELVLSSYVIFRENQFSGFRIVKSRDAGKLVENWLNMRGFGGLIESTGVIKRATLFACGKYPLTLSMTSGLDLCLRVVRLRQVLVSPMPYVFYRLSDGQFHKNEDVLKTDLKITRLTHSLTPKMLKNLEVSHANYIYWSESRRLGRIKFVRRILLALMRLDTPKLVLLYFLITRNWLALFRGFCHQMEIRAFFQAHKSTL
jgi:glycosyltransferase involved in cell wall biosynthesis